MARAAIIGDVEPAETGTPPPFFIVGNDRSGTTLLRVVLSRGGEVAIPPESMFLADFAPVRKRKDLGDPRAAAEFVRAVWEHPSVRRWNLPAPPPEVPPGLPHASAYRLGVEAPFAAYARAQGKPRWGDKTPSYVHCMDELAAVWPDARFVVLVRDGRDVALSILRLPFGPNNAWAAARWWTRGIRAGDAAARRYGAQVLTVRYEDVVTDPDTHVRRVCAHVGLAYDAAMLSSDRSHHVEVPSERSAWVAKAFGAIDRNAIGRWRRELPEPDRRIFERIAAPELEAHGYEVASVPGAAPSAPLYAGHDLVMRVANFARLRLVQERGRELRWVVKRKVARLP